jgi:multiple sugar transport system permease protein
VSPRLNDARSAASRRARRLLGRAGLTLLAAAGAAAMVLPFVWLVSSSLKDSGKILALPPEWIPRPARFGNYAEIWRGTPLSGGPLGSAAPLLAAYINSLFVTAAVTTAQLVTSSMAAFAFARLRFPFRDRLFLGYLATMMIPAQVTIIPVFIILRTLGWLDSYQALIVPFLSSAYGTFLLRQYFLGIPRDLVDAAVVDGCGPVGVFRHVFLPLARPAVATLAVLAFLATWNDFLWPLIVISSPGKMTLPLMLNHFVGQYGTNWTRLLPATVVALLPVIAVYIIGQRYITRGFVLSGIKG